MDGKLECATGHPLVLSIAAAMFADPNAHDANASLYNGCLQLARPLLGCWGKQTATKLLSTWETTTATTGTLFWPVM